MKLTIKTLQQSSFKVEIEPDKTVKDLKETIEKQEGEAYPCAAQKLIYSGKILVDEKKLSEYEFDEKKFVVLMITRPPPVVKPPETAEKPSVKKEDTKAKSSTSQEQDSNKPKATATITSTSSTSQPSPTRTTTSTTTPSTVTSATTQPQQQQHSATGNRLPPSSGLLQAAMNEASALSMGEPNATARLAAMMTQPQFRQMQELIQQSPHLLSSTIEALAASDPEMYSFISENPDVFVSALNHPPLAGSRPQSSRGSTTGNPRGPGEHQASGGGHEPGTRQQPVVDQILGDASEHDKEAIERLKELGFSELAVVQAYMACDKDEQLAANLLFQMDQ